MNEPDPPTLKTKILGSLFWLILRILDHSCTARFINGRRELDALEANCEPKIICHWHNRMVYFAHFFQNSVRDKGLKITMMSSLSKDGNLGAYVGKISGGKVVRGSPSRRGSEGLREIYRVMVQERRCLVLLPDGSKGPVYEVKIGAIALAKLTGTAIIPTSYWASDYWRIPSWDRMIIPKPFSRIAVTVGSPIVVGKRLKGDELEAKKEELQAELDRLGHAAIDAFPRTGSAII